MRHGVKRSRPVIFIGLVLAFLAGRAEATHIELKPLGYAELVSNDRVQISMENKGPDPTANCRVETLHAHEIILRLDSSGLVEANCDMTVLAALENSHTIFSVGFKVLTPPGRRPPAPPACAASRTLLPSPPGQPPKLAFQVRAKMTVKGTCDVQVSPTVQGPRFYSPFVSHAKPDLTVADIRGGLSGDACLIIVDLENQGDPQWMERQSALLSEGPVVSLTRTGRPRSCGPQVVNLLSADPNRILNQSGQRLSYAWPQCQVTGGMSTFTATVDLAHRLYDGNPDNQSRTVQVACGAPPTSSARGVPAQPGPQEPAAGGR
jgi:hypothetical protein